MVVFYVFASVLGVLLVISFFEDWNGVIMIGIAVVLAIFLAMAIFLGFRGKQNK